jgi:hypothetical protein
MLVGLRLPPLTVVANTPGALLQRYGDEEMGGEVQDTPTQEGEV